MARRRTAIDPGLIERLHGAVARSMRRMKAVPEPSNPYARLNLSDLEALDFLGEAGPQTMRAVAQRIGAPLSTATSLADRLVAARLARRVADPADRRKVLLTLTSDGIRLRAGLRARQFAATEAMLAALAPEERAAFVDAFDKIADAVDPR